MRETVVNSVRGTVAFSVHETVTNSVRGTVAISVHETVTHSVRGNVSQIVVKTVTYPCSKPCRRKSVSVRVKCAESYAN